jgi:hypothetical protein
VLNRETMERQGRYDLEFGDPDRWNILVRAVAECPEFAVTGAYVDGRLSCYVISCQEDGWLHLLYKNSRTAELSRHINHALDFWILQNAGENPAIQAVGNYFVTYPTNSGLNQYKRQMGFSLVEHNLCTFFHRRLSPFLANRVVIGAVNLARSKRPGSDRLESAVRLLEGAMVSKPLESAEQVNGDQPCQHTDGLIYSRPHRSHLVFLVWWHLKRVGQEGIATVSRDAVRSLLGKIASRILRKKSPSVPKPISPEETLGLQAGDWVEIKGEAEIMATLDKNFKNRGLVFSREMRAYCGRRFQVVKRVEKIFLEESGQQRRMKNTVLLDSIHCQGIDFECDRYCFFFWREAWLRKVDGPASEELVQIGSLSANELPAQPLCQMDQTLGVGDARAAVGNSVVRREVPLPAHAQEVSRHPH